MTDLERIDSSCDKWCVRFEDFATKPRPELDGGCIGVPDIASNTGKGPDTIRNYMRGRTDPPLRWFAALSAKYRRNYPVEVAEMWQSFEEVAGLTVMPTGKFDPKFLDANGDGKVNEDDAPLHRQHAVHAVAECLVDPTDTAAGDGEAHMRIEAARACEDQAAR